MNVPSKRTQWKFGRDLLVAVIVAVCVFVGDNAADLNLGPQVTPLIVAVALGVHRYIRDDRSSE